MQRYAFLDRDGTLIKEWGRDEYDVAYPPKNTNEVVFMDGVIDGLKELAEQDYKLVLATNQSYLGTPRNPKDIFDAVMDYFYSELASHGITFEFSMVCPHALEDNCTCKKPKIGGLEPFLVKHKGTIDLENSLMFGDRDTDRQFAENLRVKFVPIETNNVFVVPRVKP
jgi:imidazoleglycerol-phosphate dehydratase/histidinol-phosphatase